MTLAICLSVFASFTLGISAAYTPASKYNELGDNLETFTPMVDAHYVELPSYVDRAESVKGSNSLWNNDQSNIDRRVNDAVKGYNNGSLTRIYPCYT